MHDREKMRLPRLMVAGLLAGGLLAGGCDVDDLLEVEDPDTVNPGNLDDPQFLDVLVNGALGDFAEAYSGDGDDALLSVTALMSDEVFSSGTFATRTATDRRNQQPPADGNTSDDAYTRLQEARRALDVAAQRVEEFEGTDDPRYAELRALEGFTTIGLGENFCSGIPFSQEVDGTYEYGQPLPTAEVFQEGIVRFDEALANGGGPLAAVGKGRALLNLGQYQEAAAAVAAVPTDFTYFIHHSESGASNPLYSLQGNGRYSLSDREGGTGLPFRSANDPRVPWFQDPAQPQGFDEAYPLYKIRRYNSFGAPVVLASGVEARLIEAEAALQAGDTGRWLELLNALRAMVGPIMNAWVPAYPIANPSLDPLTDPGSQEARVDLMFEERAFWLFGTAHRLGDMRRLLREYGRSAEQVYPTGTYHKGGQFGNDVVFPLDFDETNNPNYSIDMCDVRSPA